MSLDNMPGTQPDEQFRLLRAALSGEAENMPEIVAIFQQIKNLRESDRSLRSIRRNLDLDNVPVLEPIDEAPLTAQEENPVPTELSQLIESFLQLKREKEELAAQLARVSANADDLEARVRNFSQQD